MPQVVDEEVVMPGTPRHAPKPRGTARGGRHPQTPPRGPAQEGRTRQATPSRHAGGGPVDESRIIEVVSPVVAAAGMDLESVRVTAAGRRRLLRVVVDSDRGVSLDDAAAVSRELSTALDTVAAMGDFPYTLEVSSPGVDRPLTDPRHWRRAVGRLVQVTVTNPADSEPVTGFKPVTGSRPVTGRIVSADAEGVTLDVADDPKARRRFGYAELGAGAIQVEFGHPSTELGATGDGH
jgi:ribosome maturation factor RimP